MKGWKKAVGIPLAITLVITGLPLMQSKGVMAVDDTVKDDVVTTEDVGAVSVQSKEEVPEGYKAIRNIDDLYAIGNDMTGKYILMNDIDMSQTAPGGEYDSGNGWRPIGSDTNTAFRGVLDGNGYRIKGMHIYGEIKKTMGIGLFSACIGGYYYDYDSDEDEEDDTNTIEEKNVKNGVIMNLGMVDVDIDIIENTDTNSGYAHVTVGGIVGELDRGEINNCFTTGRIKVLGEVRHSNPVGGIVGRDISEYGGSTAIENCYSSALIENRKGIESEYTSGIGGIVGASYRKVDLVYNLGKVNDGQGNVIGGSNHGDSCFFLQGTGNSQSGGTPLTEKQMRSASYFTNFDFKNIWMIDELSSYPYPQLRSCPQVRVEKVELKSLPTKLTYDQGESLDLSGGVLSIAYEDGVVTSTALDDSMVSDVDMNQAGKQTVTLQYLNGTCTFDIEVNKVEVSSITLPEENISLNRNEKIQLSATVEPVNAMDKSVEWESDNEVVATVTKDGIVRGINSGTATITARTQNGLTASCTVTVKIPAKSIKLNKQKLTLKKGKKKALKVTINPLETTDTVQWSSSNPKIATVSQSGVIKAKKKGYATVMAQTSSGKKAYVKVMVKK